MIANITTLKPGTRFILLYGAPGLVYEVESTLANGHIRCNAWMDGTPQPGQDMNPDTSIIMLGNALTP